MKVLVISRGDFMLPYGKLLRPYELALHLSCLAKVTFAGFNVHAAKEHELELVDYADSRRFPQFVKFFRSMMEDFDVAYVHEPSTVLKAYATCLGLRKRPLLVGDFHASGFHEISAMGSTASKRALTALITEELAIRVSDRVVVASEFLGAYLSKTYGARRTTVVPNSVDLLAFSEYDEKEKTNQRIKYGNLNQMTVVFTCPRVFNEERLALDLLVRSIPYVKSRSNMLFLILGGGPIAIPPNENLKYTGYVDDLAGALNAADIAVAPYPPNAVTGGARIKLFEYWACGLPIVGTKESMRGIPEARNGLNYYEAEPTPRGLADAILAVSENPELKRRLIKNGLALANEFYNWQRQAERLNTLFVEALN